MRKVYPFLLLMLLLSCEKERSSSCVSSTSLKDLASFPIGTTYDDYAAGPGPYAQFTANHFSRITSENLLKMENLMVREDSFNFWRMGWLNRAARNGGIRSIHIHPVVWHKQLPAWLPLDSKERTTDLYKRYLEEYQLAVFEQQDYNFLKIDGVDVVNEALNEDGTLRKTLWYDAMGRDYILLAYREFSKLNPEIKLFYNDFNLESNPMKLDAALDLCDWLRSQGVRVDGIGLQMHVSIQTVNATDIAMAFEKVSCRGYMVHVSELDVSINPTGKLKQAGTAELNRQADLYYDIFRLYKDLPQKHQYGITVWGLSDAVSWIPREFNRFDAPLLFDENYERKPAYCSCLKALQK